MVVRGSAAAPTSGSKSLAQPQLDPTACIHTFSNILGDVQVSANVLIAPGTSIRADEGSPFYIGANSNIQDGVVIHGMAQGRVVGADQQDYSVWIGQNTSIMHMGLIHGPAYVGNDCFIGFRSTVFNARIGDGCIVMMHALIQDVEIPPGRYVPSGAVITTQQQADQLPLVQEADRRFASHVLGVNDALRSGHHGAKEMTCITPIRQRLERAYSGATDRTSDAQTAQTFAPSSFSPSHPTSSSMQNTRLSSETVAHVRQLLAQGLQVGSEHANKRRFQTSTWTSCTPAQSNREADVLAFVEACIAEHPGEYVRIFGIDPRAKRRVSEVIVQRPDGSGMRSTETSAPKASTSSYGSSNYSSSSSYGGHSNYSGSSQLSSEVIEKVNQFVNQGFKIGTEHADARRFQTCSWQSCSPIQTSRPAEAIAALESCLAEHSGEYVRVFGIDPKAKRRVSEIIVQRPGDKAIAPTQRSHAGSNNGYTSTPPQPQSYGSNSNGSSYGSSQSGSGRLNADVVNQVRQLLAQGYRVAAEHANARRFQTSTWSSCAPIQSTRDSEVLTALESCLAENSGEYVRLVGIDTKTKRRVAEVIVQRP